LVSTPFAPTDPGSASYQSRMEDGRLLIRQQLVGEDKSKLRRKQSELYYQGSLATAHDIKTTIANFWTFGTWGFVDFDVNVPSVWEAMAELFFLLNSPAGRVWTGLHKSLPHVFLHLTIALQHMLSPFVALGHCLEYRQAVLAGQLLAVSAYKEASRSQCCRSKKSTTLFTMATSVISGTLLPLCASFIPSLATRVPVAVRICQGTVTVIQLPVKATPLPPLVATTVLVVCPIGGLSTLCSLRSAVCKAS
jgi:hypothetical protein